MSQFAQNASQVGRVYHQVIKDVIHSCRDIFADEGCDEQVLNDLAALWKRKLHESGALERPQMRPVGPGGRQVIYGGRGPQVVRAVNGVQPMRVMNGQPVRVVYQPSQGGQPIQNLRTQQPQIIQVQQSTVNGRPVIIQRQMSNQQPQPTRVFLTQQNRNPNLNPQNPNIRQFDGVADDISSDDIGSSSDESDKSDGDCVDEPPLDSNDDETGPSVEETFDTDNVLLCQYEKVVRTKNQWKFYLKDGIMNLNGKDYLFNKASGDSDWA